ncbi:unnamed protein product [Caenorhabditis nigoni]
MISLLCKVCLLIVCKTIIELFLAPIFVMSSAFCNCFELFCNLHGTFPGYCNYYQSFRSIFHIIYFPILTSLELAHLDKI